ncbi:glycosyl hydrolase family 28-related protein [Tichowtungia aerotolerans]|uniref:Rhamnogalacturonase A/B/Epimerase-like pectate lyase domain-containing protein n=1 Tax=Tichowtungia aerotolerans TaxID=2697043 RepID=A0A6P1M9W9_9BACT|nr:glycosyl hydrolase family 28-related protein [Tichowtungia aerotolerans]QHI70717.1 hypothetical protein GT409_15140 [Tichowtungia aerotolerans]
MNCKKIVLLLSFVAGIGFCAEDDFLLAGQLNGASFDLAWESTPNEMYLVYDTSDLNSAWQLHAYKFGSADTNLSFYSFSPYGAPRPAFLRVYQGGELLAVENCTRAVSSDNIEDGHHSNRYTSNPYTEYNDSTGWEVYVAAGDMWFDLPSAGADDVTVVTQGGILTNMVTGKRLDFTAVLRPPNDAQPVGAFWGLGLSYGTDEQWPASLISVELEDNGAARFYWDGELAATNWIPDRDARYVSITFNTVSKRAAVTVNGVEYFFATNAVYDTAAPVQMVMHAAKPAGDPALFRVDRYLTSALSTSQQRIVAETSVFNPLYFGADPTGTMDSAPAFEQMLEVLGSSRHSEIFIPAGTYLLNSPVDIPGIGNTSQYGMQIRGGGEEVTQLLVNNTSGGLRFAGTSISWMQLTVRDLSLVAMQPGIEYAFFMDLPPSGVTQNRNLNLINMNVRSSQPGDGNYFKTGCLVWNSWYPKFENIKVFADGSASNGNWSAQVGLDLEDCYNPMIGDCIFSGVATGIVYAAPYKFPEDGKVKNTLFDECSTGLLIDIGDPGDGWAEPAFHVNNCDFNFRDYGIYVNGMRQLFFSHNSFQCLDTQGSAFLGTGVARDFSPTDICLNYGYTAVIDHNFFSGPSTTNRIGVDVRSSSGYVSILGNQFDMEGAAVAYNTANPVFVRDNLYGGPQGVSATLRKYIAPSANEALLDGGFEAGFFDSDENGYEYRPSGTPWDFSGGAGCSEASTAFTSGNPAPPEGAQVLFLQNVGQASQALILEEGTYAVSFYAAQRLNSGAQTQQLQVLLGGVSGGTFQPTASGTYQPFEAVFTVPSQSIRALVLKGLGVTGYDVTVFVDEIRIVKQ